MDIGETILVKQPSETQDGQRYQGSRLDSRFDDIFHLATRGPLGAWIQQEFSPTAPEDHDKKDKQSMGSSHTRWDFGFE